MQATDELAAELSREIIALETYADRLRQALEQGYVVLAETEKRVGFGVVGYREKDVTGGKS